MIFDLPPIPSDVRRFAGNATIASVVPIGILSQLPWYEISMRTFAFVASLAIFLGALTSIYLFFKARGTELWEIWQNLLLLKKYLRRVDAIDARQKAFHDTVPGSYTFEANLSGEWIWTSDSLDAILGAQSDQLHGWRWLSFVEDRYRAATRQAYDDVVKPPIGRFDECVHFGGIVLHIVMDPAFDPSGEFVTFVGRAHPCEGCDGGVCRRSGRQVTAAPETR